MKQTKTQGEIQAHKALLTIAIFALIVVNVYLVVISI
jgi:hypothetical protein